MVYAFEGFLLDTRRCELRSGDESLHLEPQVYAILRHLVEQRDRLVPKDELLDVVWGHRFVSPATLNSRIRSLRVALGDDGTAQKIVQTARGIGFRFVARVEERSPSLPPAAPLSRDDRRIRRSVTEVHGPVPGQRIRFCRGHDGIRIAYATSGSGPVLLKPANWLTHLEYDWSSPVWRHWLSELSRDHTLLRYDERGSGLSDRAPGDVSFESWVRDLETIVDELELDRIPLLGISQGCALAVAFAARHPDRVSRLVLYGGFPQGRLRRAATPVERARSEAMLQVLPLSWGQDCPAFRQFFATLFLPEGSPEQMAWFSELQRISASAEMAVQLWLAAAEIDVCDLAPRVTAPTLVLHAIGDAVVPFEQGRLLAGLIPGARFVPLEGRNHVLLETEPAWGRFLTEVRAFLAEDIGASRARGVVASASTAS